VRANRCAPGSSHRATKLTKKALLPAVRPQSTVSAVCACPPRLRASVRELAAALHAALTEPQSSRRQRSGQVGQNRVSHAVCSSQSWRSC
jgi:hypothetical protein